MSNGLSSRLTRKRIIWERNQRRKKKLVKKFITTSLLVSMAASRALSPVLAYAEDIKYVIQENFTQDDQYGVQDKDKYEDKDSNCLLYTSPSPRDRQKSRMPSSS
jgi:hypothetical protein